jgi:hypothetical protein
MVSIKKFGVAAFAALILFLQGAAAENNTSALDTLINTLITWLPYLLIFGLAIVALLVVGKMFKKD